MNILILLLITTVLGGYDRRYLTDQIIPCYPSSYPTGYLKCRQISDEPIIKTNCWSLVEFNGELRLEPNGEPLVEPYDELRLEPYSEPKLEPGLVIKKCNN